MKKLWNRLSLLDKILTVVIILMVGAWVAYAVDTKLSALTEDTTPTSDDLAYLVNDPGGTPASRKATLGNILAKAGLDVSPQFSEITLSKTGDVTACLISTDYDALYVLFQRGLSDDGYADFRIGGQNKFTVSWRTTGAFTDIADFRSNYIEFMPLVAYTPTTFAFTEDANLDATLSSSTYLLDGDNDSDNDTLDLQDGTKAGQIIHLVAAVDIDTDDTVTIAMTDTTCTNCPAIVFDKVGESAELKWIGSTWIVKSLEDAL